MEFPQHFAYLSKNRSSQETYSIIRHNEVIRKGDILNSICMEESGSYTTNEESGDPAEECNYAELIPNGYTGSVLSSVDGHDWAPWVIYAA